jgi:DNA topoisomerase-1
MVKVVASRDGNLHAARQAGLRYTSDEQPGIYRKSAGKEFVYVDECGKRIRDRTTLERIRSLVLPPAWSEVWICRHADGHLQATGRDDKGRKQYRYHDRWTQSQEESKYERLVAFAKVLPKIRRRVARDLRRQGLSREKVLAAIVQLLEMSMIRVGNDEYARGNGSYGLTTFENRHVKVRGKSLRFRFRGKSGVEHHIELESRTLAMIARKC